VSFAASLLVTLAATPVFGRVARRLGAMDAPGGRKVHTRPTPRLGGLAVALGLAIGTAAALALSARERSAAAADAAQWVVLLAAMIVMVGLGLLDDLGGLKAGLKFVVQLGAAGVVVWWAPRPDGLDLAPFWPRLELGTWTAVVGAVWIVGVMNAFNMTDGLDGLAGGVGAIAAAALAAATWGLGGGVAATILAGVTGALLGFLPHNLPRARIFLGDSGSLGVGFLLGYTTYVALARDGNWLVFPAVLVLGVPLLDLCFAVLRRVAQSVGIVRSQANRERYSYTRNGPVGLFVADRRHLHHRLLDLGLSPGRAVAVLYVWTVVLGGVAVAAVRWPFLGAPAGVALLALVTYFGPKWLYEELRLLHRGAFLPVFDHPLLKSRVVHVLVDGVLAGCAYLVARSLFDPRALVGEEWGGLGDVLLVAGASVAGFAAAGLYRVSYRHAGVSELLVVTRAVLFGAVMAGGARFLIFGSVGGGAPWVLYFYIVLSLVAGSRFSFRLLDHMYQRGQRVGRRALIYGAGRAGNLALRELLSNPELGLVPVGFADDLPGLSRRTFCGLAVYAGGDRLERTLQSLRVQDLVISTKKVAPERLAAVVEACKRLGVRVLYFHVELGSLGATGPEGDRFLLMEGREVPGVGVSSGFNQAEAAGSGTLLAGRGGRRVSDARQGPAV
jgi:UDP-GlcNAc:undecaprenyl-phosphate GlcNAc-1-phosphate transferase